MDVVATTLSLQEMKKVLVVLVARITMRVVTKVQRAVDQANPKPNRGPESDVQPMRLRRSERRLVSVQAATMA